MPDCKIDIGFDPADCVTLESGGVSGALYLFNFNDWLIANITRGLDSAISAITLQGVGAAAFKYDLTRGSSVPSSPVTINDGGKSGFVHTLLSFVPTKDMAIKMQLTKLLNFGRVVAVVVLDSSVVANVYGNDLGLSLLTYEEAPTDPGKGGGIQFTLNTPSNTTLENLPPVTFFDTDRATTLAALEALLIPVP